LTFSKKQNIISLNPDKRLIFVFQNRYKNLNTPSLKMERLLALENLKTNFYKLEVVLANENLNENSNKFYFPP